MLLEGTNTVDGTRATVMVEVNHADETVTFTNDTIRDLGGVFPGVTVPIHEAEDLAVSILVYIGSTFGGGEITYEDVRRKLWGMDSPPVHKRNPAVQIEDVSLALIPESQRAAL